METVLTKDKENLIKQISDLQNSYINYVNQNLEKLQKDNKTFSERAETVAQENDSLHNDINTLSAENRALNDENRTLRDENCTLNNENNTLRAENCTTNDENRIIRAENQYLNVSLANMTKQSKLFEDQYRSLNGKYKDTVSKLNLAEETNAQLQSQIIILQQSLSDMENSRSWKLTKPLRAIKWWLWRIFGKGKTQ